MRFNFSFLFYLALIIYTTSARSLEHYNAKGDKTTISGISSGGCAAVQYHISFSSEIKGVAVTAGGPFYCAHGNVTTALSSCMKSPSYISVDDLYSKTLSYYKSNSIDDPKDIVNDHVFLISGTKDTVVDQGVVKKLYQYYEKFVSNSSKIVHQFSLPAEHSWITKNYGKDCDHLGEPFINDCNYDSPGNFLKHFYGSLNSPTDMKDNNLLKFSQKEFVSSFPTSSMSENGYIYVPSACHTSTSSTSSSCWLHIALHGCEMGAEKIGEKFVKHSGLNEWAETNNIIVLYPQVSESLMNPQGCWDWWGYTGTDYATQSGVQNKAIHQMVERIISATQSRASQLVPNIFAVSVNVFLLFAGIIL